jgi:predicted GTPase
MSDVIVINKIDSADNANIQKVRDNIARINPNARVIDGASPLTVDKPELIRGKRVLVVEDGPTLTHGEMRIGAGTVAANKYGAAELVDRVPLPLVNWQKHSASIPTSEPFSPQWVMEKNKPATWKGP